jgi:hypothetical protein
LKRSFVLGLVLFASLLTSGCHYLNPFNWFGHHTSYADQICKEPEGYAQAQEGKMLTIPAGLESPDTRTALRIPDLKTPETPARRKGQGCLDEPPNFTLPPKPKEP